MRMLPAVGAAVALVLALSGCTGPGDPGAGETTSPATTTAEPTQPQDDPQPVLPLACSDLFTDDAASSIVGAPVDLKVGDGRLRNDAVAAALQGGVLSCIWGGEGTTDNAWNESITLDVLPDADADFDTGVWQVDDGAVVYPDGQLSEYLCSGYPGLATCSANVLVDGYWAKAIVSSQTANAPQMMTLIDRLREQLAGAGPARQEWAPPTDVLQGAYCGPQPAPEQYELSSPADIGARRAGEVTCQPSEGWIVSVLPGGAWSVPLIAAYGGSPYGGVLPVVPTEISGADESYWGDVAWGGQQWALVSVGGSAVSIFGVGEDRADFDAQATEILAAVVAAG